MTVVINLFGSSNSGKSTTAHGLCFALKKRRRLVEFVKEIAKIYALEKRSISMDEQLIVREKQWEEEARLHGKVEYVVSESPALLSPFYQLKIYDQENTLSAVLGCLGFARDSGVRYLNIFLNPVSHFEQTGRNETQDESKNDAAKMQELLTQWGQEYHVVSADTEDERIKEILHFVDAMVKS